jgi:hypothetical protein
MAIMSQTSKEWPGRPGCLEKEIAIFGSNSPALGSETNQKQVPEQFCKSYFDATRMFIRQSRSKLKFKTRGGDETPNFHPVAIIFRHFCCSAARAGMWVVINADRLCRFTEPPHFGALPNFVSQAKIAACSSHVNFATDKKSSGTWGSRRTRFLERFFVF